MRELDISNGEGIGVALFVQGCSFHCYNCFNIETWDFKMGEEWTECNKCEFLELANREYIKRISILGGEPLHSENLNDVLYLIKEIKSCYKKTKTIWLYTGYTWEEIWGKTDNNSLIRQKIIELCDIVVDGRYIDSKRDMTLKWRGSSNQRVIDVNQTLKQNKLILHCE